MTNVNDNDNENENENKNDTKNVWTIIKHNIFNLYLYYFTYKTFVVPFEILVLFLLIVQECNRV